MVQIIGFIACNVMHEGIFVCLSSYYPGFSRQYKNIDRTENSWFWPYLGPKFWGCFLSKFWLKINIFVKNGNLGQKSTFSSKVEIWSIIDITCMFKKSKLLLIKHRNFCQKSTFWSKSENRNFGKKWKFLAKIELLIKNRHFRQK